MPQKKLFPITPLAEMVDGQEADTFALMTRKEELTTKTGKPYFRVGFRDAQREVIFPVWSDSACAAECREHWKPGGFYKIRGVYRESSFGPQLEIHKLRAVNEQDAADGFDENMCRPHARLDAAALFDKLLGIAEHEIQHAGLAELTAGLLRRHREPLLTLPGAMTNHHAYAGGYLEHVLSVTRSARWLADKYRADYPDLQPPLSRDLVLAGAILHDIGKLQELAPTPAGAVYSPAGELIGHILLGRDMVREAAAGLAIDAETMLRLEHIIVSHQRLPEWGSPKMPMTPEALIVHHADDLDAGFHMMYVALQEETGDQPMTSKKLPLRSKVFRGLEPGRKPSE